MTIKIEFPADRQDIALAISRALADIGAHTSTTTAAPVPPVKLTEPPSTESCGYYECLTIADLPSETTHVLNFKHAMAMVEQKAMEQGFDPLALEEYAVALRPSDLTDPGTTLAAMMYLHSFKEPDETATSKVDENGVEFCEKFCAKAESPFYGSGKKKGQWKKRQGVDEGAYDDWYSEALSEIKFGGNVETEQDYDPAAAFAQKQNAEVVPADAGQLMRWISEQQAAGHVSADDVTGAYSALQIPFDAIFNPAYPIAQNCASIYNYLKGLM